MTAPDRIDAAVPDRLDTAVRSVLAFAANRRLYGTTVLAMPHARCVLATAHLDARIVRAVTASATPLRDYLAAAYTRGALADLATVLGARSYLRRGEYAAFGEVMRELDALLPYPSGALAALGASAPYAHLAAAEACPPGAVWTPAARVRTARLAEGDGTPLPPETVELLITDLLEEGP